MTFSIYFFNLPPGIHIKKEEPYSHGWHQFHGLMQLFWFYSFMDLFQLADDY